MQNAECRMQIKISSYILNSTFCNLQSRIFNLQSKNRQP